jgi:hypothetical protein
MSAANAEEMVFNRSRKRWELTTDLRGNLGGFSYRMSQQLELCDIAGGNKTFAASIMAYILSFSLYQPSDMDLKRCGTF